ncbi:M16 family metallopeptidase [Oceanirhabdus sp. W0125-5]|uniref:M16 family metallopeptidase n=1 Tax=Oceanirhabdus sp. W0125-5 TaxID=2999116 RepID=UPI0022F33ED8|nr:pitrilysin family protein [Oceanirhabdus sp. W0125-5]WBW98740.1 pitrilysin family protein [Oceanirhabdus sp. W0125-5]
MKRYLDYKNTTLDNGLEIVSIKKETDLVCLINAMKIGSLNEEDDERGLAHFIEHMIFKGTEKRNNKRLIDEFEETGGEYDAYTDNVSTVISITALKEEFEKSCDLLSDILINSTFKDEEIEKERKVILSEIRNSYDDIEDYSYRVLKEKAFPNNSLKYDVLGTEECVRRFSRDDILSFYNKYYNASNCKIIIVSPFDHDYVIENIKRYYGQWKKGEVRINRKEVFENTPGEFETELQDNEQSTIMYLFTFKNPTPKEELALRILDYRLGSSSNSVLFKELREKRGLCYSVHSTLGDYEKFNILYIYASVSKSDVEESKEVISLCLDKFLNEKLKFDDKFFNIIKKVYKTEIITTLEGCNDLAHFILAYILDDEDILSFYNDLDLLDTLSKEDIYEIAKDLFTNSTVSVILGRDEEDGDN